MFELIGVSPQMLFGQLMLGLINGAFYAVLSLGLAVIFGLLNVINFTHGAQYMMGAFVAYILLSVLGVPYWGALVLAPLIVGAVGVAIERTMLRRLYHLDHLYGPSAHLRAGAHHRRVVPQPIRRLGPALSQPAAGRHPISASCSCRPIAGWVVVASLIVCFGHLVRDRAHEARLLPARGHRAARPRPGPSASTCP